MSAQFSNTSTGDAPADPYKAANRDEDVTLDTKVKDLVDFMISGPVMIQALEGENAILTNRDLMGATDPKKAEQGNPARSSMQEKA